jgi:molybdenum cofactor guanylyltransferase
MKVGGIVLCGGRSSRMGRPKAWLPIGNERMLVRVVRIVSEAVSPVVVAAAPEQELPSLPPEIVIVRDRIEGRGPLPAIAAGLDELASHCDAAFVSSCDSPLLKPAFIRRLIDLLGEKSICVPKIGDYRHPLAAVYRVTVRSAVQQLLSANCLRPLDLFELLPTRVVEAQDFADVDSALQSLRNLNTPEDYTSALRELTSDR